MLYTRQRYVMRSTSNVLLLLNTLIIAIKETEERFAVKSSHADMIVKDGQRKLNKDVITRSFR